MYNDQPQIEYGCRVQFNSISGVKPTGTVVGFGMMCRNPNKPEFQTTALVELDEQYRGYIHPYSVTPLTQEGTAYVSVLVVDVDNLTVLIEAPDRPY